MTAFARILGGTVVKDTAQVYGKVKIESSVIEAEAIVCESFILEDLQISDDYFCSSEDVLSIASIKLSTIDLNSFNTSPNRVVLEIENSFFSSDVNVFQIKVNGVHVDPSELELDRKHVSFPSSYLTEGINSLTFEGRDQFKKRIEVGPYDFIVGFSTKNISILDRSGQSNVSMNIQVEFEYEGKTYKGKSSYRDGILSIHGIPSVLSGFSLNIEGAGESSFIDRRSSSRLFHSFH